MVPVTTSRTTNHLYTTRDQVHPLHASLVISAYFSIVQPLLVEKMQGKQVVYDNRSGVLSPCFRVIGAQHLHHQLLISKATDRLLL